MTLAPLEASVGDAIFRSLAGPVTPETLQAQVRRYIVAHNLQPGDRLPSEGELSTVLGNSRLIVREALRALEAVGVLESRPGSGWYVRPFDVSAAARVFAQSLTFHPRALLDLLAVRRAVEGDVLAGLAGKLPAADLATTSDLADRMAWRAERGQSFSAEDAEFHRRLLAAGGNLLALALVDMHWRVIAALHEQGLPGPAPEDAPSVAAEHQRLVDALRDGDSEAARRVLHQSHDEAQRRYEAWLRDDENGGGEARRDAIRIAIQAALLGPQTTA